MTTFGRSITLVIAALLAMALIGCSGGNGPTLPSPDPGGSTDRATSSLTPELAGTTPELLPNDLTRSNFTVTLNGEPTTVVSAERAAATGLVLCFIIDTTGSMSSTLTGVKNSIQAFADTFAGKTVYFAGVEYGDAVPSDGPDPSFDTPRTAFAPSTDLTAFKAWLGTLVADGGNDGPENHLDAMMYAKNTFSWPAAYSRHFIVMTDVYSHQRGDGTPFADYTSTEVLNAFRGWAIVHAVSPDYTSYWPDPVAPVSAGLIPPAGPSNDGVGAAVYVSGGEYADARELADGGPPSKRTHAGTGGSWRALSGTPDLTTLGIAEAITEAYTVTYRKPPSMTSADVVIRGTWTGGTATWDLGTVTF